MDKVIRFNWGKGIFLLYSGFVAMIIFLVIKSTNEKVDLVAPDYYKQELQFQDRLDQVKNTNALEIQPTWKTEKENVRMTFPETMASAKGEIYFFKPSDKQHDLKVPLQIENGQQLVPVSKLSHGAYKIQLSWEFEGTKYFKEDVIFID